MAPFDFSAFGMNAMNLNEFKPARRSGSISRRHSWNAYRGASIQLKKG
jgi:hypothetical protein